MLHSLLYFLCGATVVVTVFYHCFSVQHIFEISHTPLPKSSTRDLDTGADLKCHELALEAEKSGRNGRNFTVYLNFINRSRNVSCEDDLITLTTHGDYRFLDNLVPLVQRWKAPISVALYVPYDDLRPTLYRIAYIRTCETPLVKEWISFHLYAKSFQFSDNETHILKLWTNWNKKFDSNRKLCLVAPVFNTSETTSRIGHNLTYPVNVGRNIAREAAPTKYIFASDIELFPSRNLVPQFFKMLTTKQEFFAARKSPYVFVLPPFEVRSTFDLPETKGQLLRLFRRKAAILFHHRLCALCHMGPKYKDWVANFSRGDDKKDLDVFYISKRQGKYEAYWEPMYIGLTNVPYYEERLSYEGRRDKMVHSYKLCVLDYDFMILNNAFLVHKAGIKKKNKPIVKVEWEKSNTIIHRIRQQVQRK